MQSGKNFKIGVTVFLVTVCVLGLLGGLIAVNEVSYRLSEGERTAQVTEKSEDDVLSYLPVQCQVFFGISKWQVEWWDYYFTVLKAP